MKYLSRIRADGNSFERAHGTVPATDGAGDPVASCAAVASLLGTETAHGPRIRRRRLSATDGPFAETKEILGAPRGR